jgi:hypothetical protein
MKTITRVILLAGLALPASACCGAAAATKDSPSVTCLKEKGCPEVSALPVCAPGAEAQDLGMVLGAADTRVGKEISVRGPLRRATTVCTLALCLPGPCCNRCGASLALSAADKVDHLDPGSLFLYYDKGKRGVKAYDCAGDDSLVCCSARADGQAVIATGKLKVLGEGVSGRTYALEDARLCVQARAVQTEAK